MAARRLTLGLVATVALAACGPTFDRGRRGDEQFERDRRDCLAQTSEFSPSRYRPSTWTDWKQYARCMETKGYSRVK